jgi:hypothetical protein
MTRTAFVLLVLAFAIIPTPTTAQTTAQILPQITTPDRVETRLGTLQFRDSVPSSETVQRVYDQLDFQRGVETFLNALPGVSMYAARQGIRDAGVHDNDILLFSGLMNSQSLFLTANADTVYFVGNINLTKGPMVDEETTAKMYDQLDYVHVVNAFLNAFSAVNMWAVRKRFPDAGLNDNDVLIFSGLMDSKSLSLTTSADTREGTESLS